MSAIEITWDLLIFVVAMSAHRGGVEDAFQQSMVGPIVLSLDRNSPKLIPPAGSYPYFDLYGDGFGVHIGWVGLSWTPPTVNGTGFINASDPDFANLYVWTVRMAPALVEPGEVQRLGNHRDCVHQPQQLWTRLSGSEIGEVATFTYSNGTNVQVAEAAKDNHAMDVQGVAV
jgi:hypothetical protein